MAFAAADNRWRLRLLRTNFSEPLQQFPVPIEILATVDLMTNAVNEIEDHHFGELLQLRAPRVELLNGSIEGYPLLISSSHPAVFPDARLSDEIGMLATKFKVPRSRITEMQRHSIYHAFCDEDTKYQVRKVFNDMLQKMTNDQAVAKTKPRRGAVTRARRSSVVMMQAAASAAGAAASAASSVTEKALTAGAKGVSTSMKTMNPAAFGYMLSNSAQTVADQVGDMVGMANRQKSATMVRMKDGLKNRFGNSQKSIREVFDEFDTDGGGSLDRDEIKRAMQAMEIDGDTDLEAAMSELAAGSDGEISFEAFDSWVEDALDAGDVLEVTDNVFESIEEIATDVAHGDVHDISEALTRTLEVAELETKAAQALKEAGLPLNQLVSDHRLCPSNAFSALLATINTRAVALQRKFGSVDACAHLECLKTAKGHDKVEAVHSQLQKKTDAVGEKANALHAKADELLSGKGKDLLGDKRVQHLLEAGQKMIHCKSIEDRLELMKKTAAELLEEYEDDSKVQALMRAVGQGRKLLEDGELTDQQMQTVGHPYGSSQTLPTDAHFLKH